MLALAGWLATWLPAMATPWWQGLTVLALVALAHRHLRTGGHGAPERFELHADGSLVRMRANGAVLQAEAVTLERIGSFLSLRGHRVVDGRRRAVQLHLAADGLEADAWRRCCAWARAGLPRASAAAAGVSR